LGQAGARFTPLHHPHRTRVEIFHGFHHRPLKRAAKFWGNIFFASPPVSASLFAVNSNQINP
jgi:hypothetical protein